MGDGSDKAEDGTGAGAVVDPTATNARRMEPTKQLGTQFYLSLRCSDPTVVAADANDPIHLDATDLDFASIPVLRKCAVS